MKGCRSEEHIIYKVDVSEGLNIHPYIYKSTHMHAFDVKRQVLLSQ
jgi:hypothetical protein